jgi:hypothetical protein
MTFNRKRKVFSSGLYYVEPGINLRERKERETEKRDREREQKLS